MLLFLTSAANMSKHLLFVTTLAGLMLLIHCQGKYITNLPLFCEPNLKLENVFVEEEVE